ncbi:MAG: hypothetical protein AABZ83_06585 [candidate division NC10 bacterium]
MKNKRAKKKPAARRAAAKKPAAKKTSATKKPPVTYTPQPIQSSGWASFRYPPE